MSSIGYRRHHARLAEQRRAQEREREMGIVQPSAPSSGIKWENLKGSLLLINPKEFRSGIATTFGTADAVEADVHVIDGPGAGDDYDSTLVFPKLLSSQLKGSIGETVCGRLGQGQAKAGQSPPWLLLEASPDDLQKAEAWIAQQSKTSVASAQAPF